MYHIKFYNKIAKIAADKFDKEKYDVGEAVENPDAIMVRSASLHEIGLGKNLLAIARAGAGVNNIPIDKCSEKGIVVFNTPGANANAVKELAIASLILSSRKIVKGIEWAQSLESCDDVSAAVEKGKSEFAGPEIYGKTLGIIGLGAIGVQLANIATHLGMKVYGYDPYITVDSAWMLTKSVIHAGTLAEIYEKCDYISVHVPSNPETRGMINEDAISQMKDGVRILNLARADLADAQAVKKAISDKKVACYVTDFPTKELLGVDGIITIPHLGASTPESEDNCAVMAAKELISFIETGCIKNSVNFPDAIIPDADNVRVCVFHKNVPSMVAQISTVLSDLKINIANMVNRSKKDNAYTLIEVNGDISKDAEDRIRSIENVMRVRVIRK
jgi:D-3-phosphoglycerate dehydrogenase